MTVFSTASTGTGNGSGSNKQQRDNTTLIGKSVISFATNNYYNLLPTLCIVILIGIVAAIGGVSIVLQQLELYIAEDVKMVCINISISTQCESCTFGSPKLMENTLDYRRSMH